jgi:hypothetical protein
MTLRRLELLQWFALFAGPWAWAAQHVLVFGVTNSHCAVAVSSWSVPTLWLNILISLGAALVVGAAELAAFVVLRETNRVGEYAPGPYGRMKFFAQAALLGNVLFLVIVALDFTGATYHGCGQA